MYWSLTESSTCSLNVPTLLREHIVTSSLVSCDINDFVHVARPWSSAEAPTSPKRVNTLRSAYWDLRPPSAAGGRPGSMNRLRGACESTP
eukprot:scaffold49047_cov38-Phaeocystis_antarctica.AAC.2